MQNKTPIRKFTDLIAWQEAHNLAFFTYQLTKKFPDEEKFGLISQMHRASVSVSSNIAEGFARNSNKDKIQFYTFARGSLFEIYSQVLLSKDLAYLTQDDFEKISSKIELVSKLVSGLCKSATSK